MLRVLLRAGLTIAEVPEVGRNLAVRIGRRCLEGDDLLRHLVLKIGLGRDILDRLWELCHRVSGSVVVGDRESNRLSADRPEGVFGIRFRAGGTVSEVPQMGDDRAVCIGSASSEAHRPLGNHESEVGCRGNVR